MNYHHYCQNNSQLEPQTGILSPINSHTNHSSHSWTVPPPPPDEPSNASPIPPPLAPWELTDEENVFMLLTEQQNIKRGSEPHGE